MYCDIHEKIAHCECVDESYTPSPEEISNRELVYKSALQTFQGECWDHVIYQEDGLYIVCTRSFTPDDDEFAPGKLIEELDLFCSDTWQECVKYIYEP